jgi:hypothetical protein
MSKTAGLFFLLWTPADKSSGVLEVGGIGDWDGKGLG